MNATSVSWTLALFFGSAILFGVVRKLTEDQGAAVTLLAQLAVLALIIGAIVLVMRRLGDDDDGDGLYEVGQQDGTCTWIGTVSADLLPSLPTVDAPQEAPEQSMLLTAVAGVAAAEHHRGG